MTMPKLVSLTSGWKTYATVLVALGVAVAQYFHYPIPWYVDFGLGMLGLGFHKAGTAKNTKDILAALQALGTVAQDVQAAVVIPQTSTPPKAPKALEKGLEIKTSTGSTVVVGIPSPSDTPEEEITAALNKFQAK